MNNVKTRFYQNMIDAAQIEYSNAIENIDMWGGLQAGRRIFEWKLLLKREELKDEAARIDAETDVKQLEEERSSSDGY